MKTTVQNVWLKKAGALVACTVFLGAPTAALANGGGGNLPVASSIPVGHFPTAPTQHHVVQSGAPTSAWGSPSGGTTSQNGHLSLKGLLFPGNHSLSNSGNQENLWHGQQFLSSLPRTGNTNLAQSLFAGNSAGGASGPGLQLDLTSTNASIVLGTSIFQGKSSVTIDLGGTREVFSAGAQVTPAEYVAIRQVLGGAHQTLSLSSQGAAVGGSFSLNAVSSAQITELVVPTGVTALDYASKGTGLGITGDVLNYGTIDGVAGRGQGNTVSLNARDIVNESGGLISTKLSSPLASSLGGVISPVNLSLSAVDNISNSGNIVSSGSLSLVTTNGSISNGTLASGTSSGLNSGGTVGTGSGAVATPTIQAVHDVSLSTGSGNLINSGLITSSGGNININTANVTNDINISAAGGAFQAIKGDINVRDASYSGSSNINLNGGNYLSTNLNLYSGTGTIDGSVGQETGTLNTAAGADHLQVATANFLLGNNNVNDPTFVNSDGDIEIEGTNTFGEDVAIIASGNITAAVDGQIVDHGNNVTMVAGAFIVPGSGSPGSPDTPIVTLNTGSAPYNGNTSNPVTIDTSHSSLAGGNIDLSGSTGVNVIDTSSTTGKAGNVTLVAFGSVPVAGVSSQGQVILARGSTVNATGGGSGNGGNVTIIAGNNTANSTNTIQVGAINTGGGSAGGQGGNIGLYTAAPVTSDTPTNTLITFGTNGAITTGNTFVAGAVNPNANIGANGDLVTAPVGQSGVVAGTAGANAGNITIVAGGSVTTQNLLAFGGGGSGGDSAILNGGVGGSGGNISVTSSAAFASIAINGQVNTSGGGGGGAGSNGSPGGTGGAGGNAGTISINQQTAGGEGQTLLSTTGGVFAAQGGAGGNASQTSVGGGGGSYGGGGGGGSSGTGGIPGTPSLTPGTIGGAGGAGFFGGGGADVDGAGGGGGYTGGSAGGSAVNATAGTSSTGGNGVSTSMTAPAGGQLSGSQQGGQGVGVGVDGANIPTASGGNTVTLSSAGLTSIGGVIAGQTVSITAQGSLTFPGNVVGTASVVINDPSGAIFQASSGLTILTPNLTLNLSPTISTGIAIGSSGVPLSTNAQNIAITGDVFSTWISDQAASTNFDGSGVASANSINIVMSTNNASLNIVALPTALLNLTLNAGANSVTGGTINFEQLGVAVGGTGTGSVTLTANDLTWTNPTASNLAINANNTSGTSTISGTGGTVLITTNLVNGNPSFVIGSGNGQLNLSATASGSAFGTAGGSITLIAPTANVTVDGGSVLVGFTGTGASGNGGTIVLNVASISSASSPLVLNASGAGTGNGGSISVTTNTSAPQSIGTGTISTDVEFIATNGGTANTPTPTGGKVSFINLGNGGLTVDPNGIQLTAGSGINVNGGSITLSSSTVGASTAQLNLPEDGIGSGNGGKISITETTTAPDSVTLGLGGQFVLSAQGGPAGGNGGSVTFSTQGALLLTTDTKGNVIGSSGSAAVGPQFLNGSGGSLTLTASSFANANAGATTPLIFNASGQGTGSGGHVRINELDPDTSLTIGSGTGLGINDMQFIATNGGTGLAVGNVTGGNVTVTIANNLTNNGTGTITVDPTAISLSVSNSKTDPNVNGGFIELDAPIIVAAPSVPVKDPLVLNASGVGTGNAGGINFEESNANSSPTIGTKPGQFELIDSSGTRGGNGGAIIVASGGNLTVSPTGINVKAAGNGNGGELILSALNLGGATDGSEGNLLVTGALNVNAAGKGTGGTIGLNSDSPTAFNVGLTSKNTNGVEGGLSMTGGSGGSLDITSGGTGGIVIQTAITSPQFVTITAANTISGDVDINSTVGSTKTTEIVISADGTGNANFTASSIVGGSAGKLVTGVTSTNDFIQLTSQTDIRGVTTTTKGVTTTKQLQMLTTELTANATTGDIDVNDDNSSSNLLTINQMNAGDSINLSCSGSLQTRGFSSGVDGSGLGNVTAVFGAAAPSGPGTDITAPNTVNLNSDGPSQAQISSNEVDAGMKNTSIPPTDLLKKDFITAVCIEVAVTFGNYAVTSASSAPPSSSGSSVHSLSLANSGGLGRTATVPSAAPGTSTFGTFDVSIDSSGNILLSSNVNTVLTGFIGKSTSTSVGISDTLAGASITGSALISGKSVSLLTTGGDIGVAGVGTGIQVNSPSLSANTGGSGNVFLNDPDKTTLGITNSTAGSFSITGAGGANISNLTTNAGDINVTTVGTTTLSGLTSAGAIVATTGAATTVGSMYTTGNAGDGSISVTNATGLLQTSANAKIYAQNGSILLENENVKSGSIMIGAGSDIETGTQPSPGTGGNIALTIGPVSTPLPSPPAPAQQGLAPSTSLVTPLIQGTGVIDWGTNGISAVVSKVGPNMVTAKNADVIFNTGKLKGTAIKLNGNTTITADPPSNASVASYAVSEPSTSGPSSSSMVRPLAESPLAVAFTSPPGSVPVSASTSRLAQEDMALFGPTSLNLFMSASANSNTGSINGALQQATGLTAAVAGLQTTAAQQNNSPPILSSANDRDSRWISETETESGAIPAVLFSEEYLGIRSDVSSVLEMTGHSAPTLRQPSQSLCSPLAGGISYLTGSPVKQISLTRGSVVFAPSSSTVVETPYGTISVAAKSVVLVLALRDGLAVYDFDDSHHAAVKVAFGGKDLILAPGRHALISKSVGQSFEKINAAQLFAYRGICQHSIVEAEDGVAIRAFTAEFNLPQAINTVIPLQRLVNSKNPLAKNIARRLLKTAGIMAEISASGERYNQVLRPSMVASK